MEIDWLSFLFGAVSAIASVFVVVFVVAFRQFAKQQAEKKK